MIETSVDYNPFAPTPESTSSGELVSGGGADGQIHHLVCWMLRRVDPRPDTSIALDVLVPSGRTFDLAELLTWAGEAAGLSRRLPASTSALRALCYAQRTTMRVAAGVDTKGALLFGGGQLGVALGVRRQVIVNDLVAGVVVVQSDAWGWTEAARVPWARGYPR